MRVKRHAVTQPLDESYRFIPLTQGQNAIVDVQDFEWLSQWNWCAVYDQKTKSFYATRTVYLGGGRENRKTKNCKMHRLILGLEGDQQGDHKNRDTLDNRRRNLRPADFSGNVINRGIQKRNSSGFRGVSWEARRGEWRAQIAIGGIGEHLGYFQSKEKAARAYDKAAKIKHREFAQLNFPS
jgi:hypothetical protein